jgi:S1-C subfamily serine protease
MRWFSAAVVIFFILTSSSQASLHNDCDNSDSSTVVITACSQLLERQSLLKRHRSEILAHRANAYLDTGAYASALRDSRAAIKLAPDWSVSYFVRAHVQARLGKRVEALKDIKSATNRAKPELQLLKLKRIRYGSNMALKRELQRQIKATEAIIRDGETFEAELREPTWQWPAPPERGLVPPQPEPAAEQSVIFDRVVKGVVLVTTDNRMGAGIIVSSTGQILTSWHVVESKAQVLVAFYKDDVKQSDFVSAQVIKTDPSKDLALLQLDAPPENLTVFRLGELSSLSVGQQVNAIGHPDGAWWSFTQGAISRIRPGYGWSIDNQEYRADVIQTQAPMNPGNSGGPLFDNDGNLIGINTFIFEGTEGIHWAVAVSEIKKFVALPAVVEKAQPIETLALRFVENYFRSFSASDREGLGFLEASYAASVVYFGSQTEKIDVINDKREFFQRWPERSYRLRPVGISVGCALNSCYVSGTVDWEVGSRTRHDWRRGAADYQFEVVGVKDSPLIRLETSEVTSRLTR